MIVVFGPKHYGKENVQNRYGFCEQCGAHGLLSSYDTSSFFTVYYVPLIPLGRKRVLDACPACKMHREAKLKDYRRRRDRALHEAVEGMRAAPQDAEKAMEAIQTYVTFGAKQDFQTMAPVLAGRHPAHPRLHGVIGAAHEYYGDAHAAEPYYRQALNLADTPEHREALAVNLVYLARPDEARPYLDHVATGSEKEKAGLIYLLAGAYRELGRHAEALEMLDAVERLDPALADDEEHRQLRSTSEGARAGAMPLAGQVGRPREAPEDRGGVPTIIPRMVPLGLVLLIVGGYLFAAWWKGMQAPVWLVSGTMTTYTVTINHESFEMRPFDRRRVTLREGTWEIAISDTLLPVEPFRVSHRTPFFPRPFRYPVAVLNPDGLAVLVRETTTYSTAPDPGEGNYFDLSCGETLYRFKGIHFPFVDFPEEISLSSDNAQVRRTRLYVLTPDEDTSLVQAALSVIPPGAVCEYLKRRARIEPYGLVNVGVLYTLCAQKDIDDFLVLLREGMEMRPALVDWHRMYQEAMDAYRPEHDLTGEYRALMEAEPEAAEFKYLLGRVLPDPEEAKRLFLASEETGTPSGRGYNAVAFKHLCSGDFTSAVAMTERALAANPDHLQFKANHDSALLALERYAELLAAVQARMEKAPLNPTLVEEEIRYLTLLGRRAEAEEAGRKFLDDAGPFLSEPDTQNWSNHLAAVRFHAQGDVEAHAAHLERTDSPGADLAVALLRMDLDATRAALSEEETDTGPFTSYLLAYGLAVKLGRQAEAEALLAQALERLDAGNGRHRDVAAMLRGEKGPDGEVVNSLQIQSGEKAVLAVALGLTFPEVRDPCFEIAALHNYRPGFPQHVIRRLME